MAHTNHQDISVFQLVYVSSATSPLELGELKAIETASIRNNAELDLSGILTYCSCKFMQFLEGEQSHVEEIFSVIKCDSRHYSIDILRQGIIPVRQFSGWEMKYADINDIHESKGIIHNKLMDIITGENKILEHATESLSLLVAFKNSCLNKT